MKYVKKTALFVALVLATPFVSAELFDLFAQGTQHTSRPLSFFDSDASANIVIEPELQDDAAILDAYGFTPDIPGQTEPAESLGRLPNLPENRPHNRAYIIISTHHNRLWLMHGEDIQRVAVCATGKGDTLHWEEGGKTWVFNTPTGEFAVQHKTTNPRWIPPEWHYVEQGEVPPDWLGRAKSADYDMLGDAAINFGNEYNIHGTLFEGLLGRSITHGCVRIGARDLAYIYPRVGRGTKVFIY
jgi:L,D-transpeptidase ErfK/SrfK